MLKFLLLLALTTKIFASPFDLTDNYIKEFKSGIENLKKLSETHQFNEENYNPTIYNETQAQIEAETYDFVIVGGGTSGSIIANRLSEVPEWKILLLEAGNDETDYTKVPNLNNLLLNTPYNWNFPTTPQKNWCLGMTDHICNIDAGKVLGGSSSINSMLYTRGNPKDYDLWADASNQGWCYKNILPYYKKAEDAHLKQYDHKYHHQGGLFHIENVQYQSDLVEKLQQASQELNYDFIDYNGEQQLGLGTVQISTKNGKRQSTNTAYLKPAKNRKNLHIQPNSFATKILIGHHSKVATGVEYVHNNKLFVAKAEKEIILTAGALNTPKLLQLSGIGPKDVVEKVGITSIVDLPVGQTMKDHIAYYGLDFVTNQTENHQPQPPSEAAIIDYLRHGKGPLTSPDIEVIGYFKTDNTQTRPDIELFFLKKKIPSKPHFNIKPDIFDNLWRPLQDQTVLNIGVMLTHPKSTGTVKIRDADPFHQPLIDPNQLSDAEKYDLDTLVKGIHLALNFTKTKALQNYKLNENKIPNCAKYELHSDEYWQCSIRHLTVSLRHVTGTCRMGPKTDKTAVVNDKLQVYNVEKLRVCDTSIIPITITGHTMAVAVLIGEKASDLIKNDWQ